MSEVVPTEIETVPEGTGRFKQAISVVVGCVAVVAALLAILEADSHRRNAVASARASRLAVDIFVDTAASGPYNSFSIDTQLDALGLALQSTARQLAAFEHPDVRAIEVARAKAEAAAATRVRALAKAMAKPPSAADGVDPVTLEAVAASPASERELVETQNDAVDRAERYARRETRAILGLSLSATAAALLGLAGLMGAARPGKLLFVVALLSLLGAVAAGASGLAL